MRHSVIVAAIGALVTAIAIFGATAKAMEDAQKGMPTQNWE